MTAPGSADKPGAGAPEDEKTKLDVLTVINLGGSVLADGHEDLVADGYVELGLDGGGKLRLTPLGAVWLESKAAKIREITHEWLRKNRPTLE